MRVQNALMTQTLKIKRDAVAQRYLTLPCLRSEPLHAEMLVHAIAGLDTCNGGLEWPLVRDSSELC
jgi:hypothetical protein